MGTDEVLPLLPKDQLPRKTAQETPHRCTGEESTGESLLKGKLSGGTISHDPFLRARWSWQSLGGEGC